MSRDIIPSTSHNLALARENYLDTFLERLKSMRYGDPKTNPFPEHLEKFVTEQAIPRDNDGYGLLMVPKTPMYCTRFYDETGHIIDQGGYTMKGNVVGYLVTFGGFHPVAHINALQFYRYCQAYFHLPGDIWGKLLSENHVSFVINNYNKEVPVSPLNDPRTVPVEHADIEKARIMAEVLGTRGDVFYADRQVGTDLQIDVWVLPEMPDSHPYKAEKHDYTIKGPFLNAPRFKLIR